MVRVPDAVVIIFLISIAAIITFIIRCLTKGPIRLIHKIYFCISALEITWLGCIILMKFTDNMQILFILDCITYLGATFTPVLSFWVVFTFINSLEKMNKKLWLMLIIPIFINIIVWTNNYYLSDFSLNLKELEFSSYAIINGLYSYGLLIISVVYMIRFAIQAKNKLYLRQGILFLIGNLIPFIINTLALIQLESFNIPIWATPLGVVATMLCQGIVIYQFHLLDIRPIATQAVLDMISDGFLLISDDGLVLNYNVQFSDVFGVQYGINENNYIKDFVKANDLINKTGLYNLLTAIDSCRNINSIITYEEAVYIEKDGHHVRRYYVIDVTPLNINKKTVGFIILFKDVTKVKESMLRLQSSNMRLMDQERLASLGQMVGGLAHNLKTPIMSISGSVSAVDSLINECLESIGDPEVTNEDYSEICGEVKDWLYKIRESCSYMSDIITAVKGQAANMNTSDDTNFTIDEVIKRSNLLLRHELIGSGCSLIVENTLDSEIILTGDINNFVQAVNNLISNAIDAQKKDGRRDIIFGIDKSDTYLLMTVKDFGEGMSDYIKSKLFKQMITSKGAQGTGLGIYMSNTVIRAKFGGTMWVEDNPEGGCIFGISLPLENVIIKEHMKGEEI